jgi:hypothetical protein
MKCECLLRNLFLLHSYFLLFLIRGNWEPWIVSHITTIAEIEKLTGINFLATMSASKRAQVENAKATALWPTQ